MMRFIKLTITLDKVRIEFIEKLSLISDEIDVSGHVDLLVHKSSKVFVD